MKPKLLINDFVSAYRAYIETVFNRAFEVDEKSTEKGITYYNLLQHGKFPVH